MSQLYEPLRPGLKGRIFTLEKLCPVQLNQRSLVANGTLGDVALRGIVAEELVMLFQYYHWDGVMASQAHAEQQESSVWHRDMVGTGLKMLVKAPALLSSTVHPDNARAGFFLRILFYRHNPFGDGLTLVDHVSSSAFRCVSHHNVLNNQLSRLRDGRVQSYGVRRQAGCGKAVVRVKRKTKRKIIFDESSADASPERVDSLVN